MSKKSSSISFKTKTDEATSPLISDYETIFFQDGKRKIDAILVYKNRQKWEKERDIFITNLESKKLQLEYEYSGKNHEEGGLIFLKVHAPKETLLKYASKYDIPLKCKQKLILPDPPVHFDCMKTVLTESKAQHTSDVEEEESEMSKDITQVSRGKMKHLTSSERSAIVFAMMDYIRYGNDNFQVGLSQLLHKKCFIAAFPLHDGPWQWPQEKTHLVNDRQLLAKYWSNYKMWNKQQPLNVVEKYLGFEIALYFAWLGFYNKMLIIAAFFGIITFCFGILTVTVFVPNTIREACASQLILCPNCKTCDPKLLKQYCKYFRYAYLNDNVASVVFACAMSFWASFFMEFWKRESAILLARWNIHPHIEEVNRPDFIARAKKVRKHPYTGEVQLYIPASQKVFQYTISVSVVAGMVFLVLLLTFCLIMYECFLKMIRFEKTIISVTSSILTVITSIVMRKIYVSVAHCLTVNEVPRTQLEFDKSYMLKMILFSLVNSFAKMIYIAFFKGKFFTYPGDCKVRDSSFPIATEVCDPTGCVSELFLLLASFTILKPFIDNSLEIAMPILKIFVRKVKKLRQNRNALSTWEQEYHLNPVNRFSIMAELEELVIQFGMVTLLVPAFPLAPLAALINNVLEIRIDSSKIVKYHRRPVMKSTSSLTIWFDAVHAMTYLAVITNAFFITFTSNFIPSIVYYLEFDRTLRGFSSFSLSKFKIDDNYWPNAKNLTECWYVGYRYPPGDKNEYQYTYLHYYLLSYRLAFAIGFTVFVLFTTGIISYMTPDIPENLKDFVTYNKKKEREI